MVIYAYKLYSKKPPFHAWFCRVVTSKFFQNNLMVTVIYFFRISDLFLFLSLPVWILILMRRKIICFPLKFKHQGKFEIKLFREPCRTIAAKVHLKEINYLLVKTFYTQETIILKQKTQNQYFQLKRGGNFATYFTGIAERKPSPFSLYITAGV